uniref:Putative salivary secreted protein n=1 Tax=Anopheles braziliensis TaxID=58242 RepID=A0A2M3Z8R3_9DIPT
MSAWYGVAGCRCMLLLLAVACTLPSGIESIPSRRQCFIAREELSNLIDLLNNMDEPYVDSEPEDFDTLEDPDTPSCSSKLERIRVSVKELHKNYHALKQIRQDDPISNYRISKYRYETKLKNLNQTLFEFVPQVSNQDLTALNQLRRKVKEVEIKLAKSVNNLQKQREQTAVALSETVIQKIRTNSRDAAITEFKYLALRSDDPYRIIVPKVYRGTDDDARKMIDFLEKVDFNDRPIGGYEVLVDRMITDDKLRGENAVRILKGIQAIIMARVGQQHERAVALLKRFRMNAH